MWAAKSLREIQYLWPENQWGPGLKWVKEYGATPERYAGEGNSPEFDYHSAQTLGSAWAIRVQKSPKQQKPDSAQQTPITL